MEWRGNISDTKSSNGEFGISTCIILEKEQKQRKQLISDAECSRIAENEIKGERKVNGEG